jgi:hypothetical protein
MRLTRDGSCKIVWNVKRENPNAVLAYQMAVPSSAGFVLLNEGHVFRMTAAGFKQAMDRGQCVLPDQSLSTRPLILRSGGSANGVILVGTRNFSWQRLQAADSSTNAARLRS